MSEAAPQRGRAWSALLAVAVLLVYAPTLGAGWLEYDDDWLVRDNPFFSPPTLAGLGRIWGDLTRATRLALGAEYLPVRDTSEWIAAGVVGVTPFAHRAIDLAIYLAGCLLLRAWLVRALPGRPRTAELAALLFALHPVHAESVAWIAGRKDVLALLFVALALRGYASDDPRVRRAIAPVAVGLACFAKASSVVAPLLLLVHDGLAGRRPDRVAIAGALVPALGALAVHLVVGDVVGMIAPLPGGSRAAAVATMGPVLVRYLGLSLGVVPGSIVHDVPERGPGDPVALAAWAAVAAGVGLAAWAFRRGERLPALALAWAAIALAPVSQVLAPLQNRMADRYLLLAVLGPLLLVAAAADRAPERLRRGVAALLVVAVGAMGLVRALTFAQPVSLWIEASEEAPADPAGPYQLAMALRPTDPAGAEAAFREAARRDAATDVGRRARNNLAILLADQGRTEEAIAILEEARPHYPGDPRIVHNLARLHERAGHAARAAALRAELAERFPGYRPPQ